ncbi:MAG: DUF721 domain-containing protein [Gammaproteobacteria bacterium]|nr:DUF721 domain-containing protein [Gammaproteobacteria bacterium]
MSRKRPSLKSCLASPSPELGRLLGRVQELERLTRLVQSLLPESLRAHCRVISVRGATLVLQTDSPVWATKLRLAGPSLERALQSANVRQIEIKIQPISGPRPVPPRHPALMSKSTATLLLQLAGTMNDPKLKEALHRLSRHGRKSS